MRLDYKSCGLFQPTQKPTAAQSALGCVRKTNMSTFFGNWECLVMLIIQPALENIHSAGIDETWVHFVPVVRHR